MTIKMESGKDKNVKVESDALNIKKEPKLKEKGGKKKAENKMKVCREHNRLSLAPDFVTISFD